MVTLCVGVRERGFQRIRSFSSYKRKATATATPHSPHGFPTDPLQLAAAPKLQNALHRLTSAGAVVIHQTRLLSLPFYHFCSTQNSAISFIHKKGLAFSIVWYLRASLAKAPGLSILYSPDYPGILWFISYITASPFIWNSNENILF